MKRIRLVKGLAALLFLFFVMLTVNVNAVDARQVDASRFMCRSIGSDSASIFLQESGSVVVSFRSKAPVLELIDPLLDGTEDCNAVRVVLKNNSACNGLVLLYTKDGVECETKIPIARRSGKAEYFFYLDGISKLSDLSLSLSGAYNGTVEFYSVSAVSVYDDTVSEPGSILECVYRPEEGTVRISGTVDHEIAVNTKNAKVALYAFGMDEEVTHLRINYASHIVSVPLSVRFEFEVDASDRFLQYVVVIADENGRALYSFVPRCPSVVRESRDEAVSFKGVCVNDATLAVRSGATTAVVDVYLDKMHNPKNTGLVHIAENRYFYIDRFYVSELDKTVDQYKNNGCHIYFRFLLSQDGSDSIFRASVSADAEQIKGFGFAPKGDDDRFSLLAYTDFLCSRYEDVGILGIVVGRGVNYQKANHFVGAETLMEYTDIYGETLYIISQSAWANDKNIEIIVPVAGVYDDGGFAENGEGQYPMVLFLTSLSKTVSSRFGMDFAFKVMVENASVPSVLVGETDEKDVLSAERMEMLESELSLVRSSYSCMKNGYLYYWEPVGEIGDDILESAFLYTYYKMTTGKADAFIFSVRQLSGATDFVRLFETVRYVDTQLGAAKNSEAAKRFGVTDWSTCIPKLNMDAVATKEIFVSDNALTPDSNMRGRYVMWDARQGRNIYDWYADSDSRLTVEDVAGYDRVLTARAPSKSNVYTEILYAYSAEGVMKVVDMLSVDVLVEGEKGETYEVLFEIGGENAISEAVAYVPAGEKITVFLSTLDLDRNDPVRSIRMFWRSEGGNAPYSVCVSNLVAHSADLDHDSLAEEIRMAGRSEIDNRYEDDGFVETSRMRSGFLLVAVVFLVSAVIVILLAKRNE